MSKVVAGFSMSLDGFVADPAGVRLATRWPLRSRRLTVVYSGSGAQISLDIGVLVSFEHCENVGG
jgi:hypothetical protein